MDAKTVFDLMSEDAIPLRCKFDDLLSVALGVRRAAQIVIPAELPDAMILGATIDERFNEKMRGRRLPGESLGDWLKSKSSKFLAKNRAAEIRYRTDVLRQIYKSVVENAHSYQVLLRWIKALGLSTKELESRPTIRELYVFTDPSVAAELDELQDLRKDIRFDAMRSTDPSLPAYAKAFPEERNVTYLKKLGLLLGFPACCVERYVFDRQSGIITPEARAASQLGDDEKPSVYAYFVKDFFPCQPDCAEASKLGRKMEEALSNISPELGEKYREHLANNMDLVKRYPEIIQKKIESLERITSKAQEVDDGGVQG